MEIRQCKIKVKRADIGQGGCLNNACPMCDRKGRLDRIRIVVINNMRNQEVVNVCLSDCGRLFFNGLRFGIIVDAGKLRPWMVGNIGEDKMRCNECAGVFDTTQGIFISELNSLDLQKFRRMNSLLALCVNCVVAKAKIKLKDV